MKYLIINLIFILCFPFSLYAKDLIELKNALFYDVDILKIEENILSVKQGDICFNLNILRVKTVFLETDNTRLELIINNKNDFETLILELSKRNK